MAATFSVSLVLRVVTGFWPKLAVTPAGVPTILRLIGLANPLIRAISTAMFCHPPCTMVRCAGTRESWNVVAVCARAVTGIQAMHKDRVRNV